MGLFSKLFGRKKKSDPNFLSIVFLLRRPRTVDDPRLRTVLAAMVKSVFKMDAPPPTHVQAMSEHAAGLVIEGQPFVVMGVAEPYTTQNPEEITPDLRKQNLLKAHKAWIACDWMPPVESDDDRKVAYRTMGMVMALVAKCGVGEDVIAVFDKATTRLVPFEPHVIERLAGEFPESTFDDENPPILSSDGLEAELKRATEEAQARLPEFVLDLQRRRPGQKTMFAIKARFEDGDAVEWMWVKVERLTEEGFEGRLDNNPDQLKRLKAGDRVAVMLDEVADWMIKDDAGLRGGFSVAVFERHANAG